MNLIHLNGQQYNKSYYKQLMSPINVMSQYLAQCTALRIELTEKGYENLHVSTVVSSQG
jgi:hypothetical protein